VIGVGAYILDPDNWVSVMKCLKAKRQPVLRPGVFLLGTIERGRRKYLFTNEDPEVKSRERRPPRSTDKDTR
jgi:hypothetical protein